MDCESLTRRIVRRKSLLTKIFCFFTGEDKIDGKTGPRLASSPPLFAPSAATPTLQTRYLRTAHTIAHYRRLTLGTAQGTYSHFGFEI